MFLSYAREDTAFVEGRLTRALVARGKDVWIDVEDIRVGASDWRAGVWAGIESATVMVFVLTPDSLASTVCGEELQRAEELNKRIIPVLRRSVDGLQVPPSLERPNWILARPEDDFEASVTSLVDALELDEAWVEQHARLAQRTGEWLRHERDGSYLLRGSDLRTAERWLDDQGAHREAPTAQQVTYITASRREAARRQRGLLAGVVLALVLTAVLAVVAIAQRATAIDRERTARAQARAAQSIAALSRDPEESVRDALEAVEIRADEPEALYALRRAVSTAGWTSILRLPDPRGAGLLDVDFSADGRRVATSGSDGRVAVWNTRTGRRITVLTAEHAVHTVQFSPDGRQLLTASEGGIAQTWDSSTGRPRHEFDTKSKDVWAATYGAGGRRILTASLRGGEVWAARSGALLRPLRSDGQYFGAIRMSLDGRRALTAGKNGTALLWDVATGRSVTLPGKKKNDPLAFSLFSSDGRRYATFYDSGRFCVWEDGRITPRFCRAGSKSSDVDFSPDGRRVLRAGRNAIVEVWDVGSRRPHRIAVLHNGGTVSSAQFDRSGEYVVTAGDDGVARVWQVKPRRRVAVLRGHTDGVIRARFSPDGSQVATVSDDGSGRLWPAGPRTPADPRWQSAAGTAFSPNSRDVLVVRRDRRSAVWNTDTPRIVPLPGRFPVTDPPTRPCGRVFGCSPWSPDGRLVAGADAASGAVVWDARTGEPRRFGKKTGTVSGAAFSPDGRRLVVVDGNQKGARIWDVATRTPRLLVPGDFLFSAQFVADRRVLTVDISGRAQLVDPATRTTVALSRGVLPVGVTAARDGRQIAVGTTDGKLRLFSGAGAALRSAQAPGGAVNTVAFDRAGRTIVTGGQKGTAVTWDARTLTPTLLRAPGGQVTGAAFGGRDGDLVLVTAGATARLWDRTLPRVIVALPSTPDVHAELSPDGSRIVIAGKTRLEVLRCDACASLEALERRARSLLPAP